MRTTSSTSVSPSYSDSCTALVSPPDNYLVTGVKYASVYTSSSSWVTGDSAVYESIEVPDIELPFGWVTWDYAVYELIAVPDLELPVPEVIFLASELTVIESTVVSS